MKLRPGFITQDVDDTQFLIGVGDAAFNGIVRSNKTAAFIIDCLKQDTTEEAIVDAMFAEYDASKEKIAKDVRKVLDTLRSVNAIED